MFCIISKRSILSPNLIDELSHRRRILRVRRIFFFSPLCDITPRELGLETGFSSETSCSSQELQKGSSRQGVPGVDCSDHGTLSLPHATQSDAQNRDPKGGALSPAGHVSSGAVTGPSFRKQRQLTSPPYRGVSDRRSPAKGPGLPLRSKEVLADQRLLPSRRAKPPRPV